MTIMSTKSFCEGKADNEKTGDPTWNVSWVYDGACFKGSITYSIPEADIAKYLEMEKVTVQ